MKDNKALVLLVLIPQSSESTASTDGIRSRSANEAYRNNYDTIFGSKKVGQA